jgi:hypothetical protein
MEQEKIRCPDCGNESSYKLIPKVDALEEKFSTLVLQLSCNHEFVMINSNDYNGIRKLLADLDERVKVIEERSLN